MRFGFIGNGNMGRAIVCGMLDNNIVKAEDITVSDIDADGLKWIKSKYGVNVTTDNKTIAEKSDVLFLCVKPQFLYFVIEEIKDTVLENTIIVSIAAGQSIQLISEAFGKPIKLVRVMPNTPALVGEGMSAISPNENVSESENKIIIDIFNSLFQAPVLRFPLQTAPQMYMPDF